MIYAVASGKGGTGKTTVSASLVSLWNGPVTAVDLDVEEPNLHLFLHPEEERTDKAFIEVPELDESLCTHCRACSEICQFKAIAVMGEMVLTFPEMCHGCGACLEVCPEGALSPGKRELGEIVQGRAGNAGFVMGRLRVGEAMSPPLMRQVKTRLEGVEGDVIIDAPPGVSCPAVSAVTDTDCIVLVTEPTPFGLYDFRLAYEAFSPFGIPMGAVINRAGVGDDGVYEYCREKDIPIWAEIPFDRAIAQAYSQGRVVAEALTPVRPIFLKLAERMREAAKGGRHA